MKKLFLFICLSFSISVFSQEQINQRDANGKKHGVWIVWLDSDWKLAKDSTSAIYCRYNYFEHGANIYCMGPWGGKNTRLEGIPNSTIKKGNAKLLDGVYKWYNSKGQLVSEHVLKNGWYVSFKEYFPASGQLQTHFDYTKHENEDVHSYLMLAYNKKGEQVINGFAHTSDGGGKGVDN